MTLTGSGEKERIEKTDNLISCCPCHLGSAQEDKKRSLTQTPTLSSAHLAQTLIFSHSNNTFPVPSNPQNYSKHCDKQTFLDLEIVLQGLLELVLGEKKKRKPTQDLFTASFVLFFWLFDQLLQEAHYSSTSHSKRK